MNRSDAIRILGVPSDADRDAMRTRYRFLAGRYHPDRFLTPGERAVATTRFQQIAEAWTYLQDSPFIENPRATRPGEPVHTSEFSEERDESISAWDLLRPLRENVPVLDFLLDILWVPLLFPLAFSMTALMAVSRFFRNHPRTWNLLFSLSAHVIPGIFAIALGRAMIVSDEFWPSVMGWWFISGGAVAVILELVAQGLGFWRLNRYPQRVTPYREIVGPGC